MLARLDCTGHHRLGSSISLGSSSSFLNRANLSQQLKDEDYCEEERNKRITTIKLLCYYRDLETEIWSSRLVGGPGSRPPAFVSKQHAPFSLFGMISDICRHMNKDSMRETHRSSMLFLN